MSNSANRSVVDRLNNSLDSTCDIPCTSCSFVFCQRNPDYKFKNLNLPKGPLNISITD